MPERCRFRRLDGLPRVAAPPATPSIQCSGCPSIRIVRLCRRWSTESPRSSHPSAVPIGRSSGCPASQSFGIADDPLCESPRVANLPAPAGLCPELPRAARPPVLRCNSGFGLPLVCCCLQGQLLVPRVAPFHLPLAAPTDKLPGFPKTSGPSALPRIGSTSCPAVLFLSSVDAFPEFPPFPQRRLGR